MTEAEAERTVAEASRLVVEVLNLLQEVLHNDAAVEAMGEDWLKRVALQMGATRDG